MAAAAARVRWSDGREPHLAALPLESLSAEIGQLVATEGLVALQYGSAHGVPDDVVVTVGSQMGLGMVTRIFCDPGDAVIASWWRHVDMT